MWHYWEQLMEHMGTWETYWEHCWEPVRKMVIGLPFQRWWLTGIAPSATTKRSWVQTQWCAGETPANSLPKSLTRLCQQLVRLGLLVCLARNKKEKKKSLIRAWGTSLLIYILSLDTTQPPPLSHIRGGLESKLPWGSTKAINCPWQVYLSYFLSCGGGKNII